MSFYHCIDLLLMFFYAILDQEELTRKPVGYSIFDANGKLGSNVNYSCVGCNLWLDSQGRNRSQYRLSRMKRILGQRWCFQGCAGALQFQKGTLPTSLAGNWKVKVGIHLNLPSVASSPCRVALLKTHLIATKIFWLWNRYFLTF